MRYCTTRLLVALLILGIVNGCALRDGSPGDLFVADKPVVVAPRTLVYSQHPHIRELSAAWMIGSEAAEGLYLLRVRLRSGGAIPCHTHPDTRLTTVLSGRLLIAFGRSVKDGAFIEVLPGESYSVPAGMPHCLRASAGDVEYQEMGKGPSGTQMLSAPLS